MGVSPGISRSIIDVQCAYLIPKIAYSKTRKYVDSYSAEQPTPPLARFVTSPIVNVQLIVDFTINSCKRVSVSIRLSLRFHFECTPAHRQFPDRLNGTKTGIKDHNIWRKFSTFPIITAEDINLAVDRHRTIR